MDPIRIVPATADLCDDRGDEIQVAKPILLSYGAITAFAGVIETVQVDKDSSLIDQTLSEPGEDRVLVVDGGGEMVALVGDRLATLALGEGWAGIVVNGYVRDTTALSELSIGVLALGEYPKRSFETSEGKRSVDVEFADVTFKPGAWLCADADGVVVADAPVF